MSTALQWVLVAAIVAIASVYALRAVLPPSWRRALARGLRARGNETLAARFDSGGGCDACPANAAHGVHAAGGARAGDGARAVDRVESKSQKRP